MALESLLTSAAEGMLTKVASLAAHQDFGMALGLKDELSKLSESFSMIQDILACFQASTRSRQGSRGVGEET